MKRLIPILDPAHGIDTPGKRSPDGNHREYEWSRKICSDLYKELTHYGFQVEITNKEEKEIGLTKRKNIANAIKCSNNQIKFLLSIHNNAAGSDGQWKNARGIEIYTSKGQTLSDKFADIILNTLMEDFSTIDGHKYRVDLTDHDLDKEANFTVLMGNYSAVLLEWLFQDNIQDVGLLNCPLMNYRLVQSIVKSLLYIDEHLNEL